MNDIFTDLINASVTLRETKLNHEKEQTTFHKEQEERLHSFKAQQEAEQNAFLEQ